MYICKNKDNCFAGPQVADGWAKEQVENMVEKLMEPLPAGEVRDGGKRKSTKKRKSRKSKKRRRKKRKTRRKRKSRKKR